jgi:glycosyltransferase involved in cell wall biosynthesis
MRIAQVAPLAEAVPPKLYGGTERVVHWLTEGLVARGHEVTLFASGDSRTSARLVACAPTALRLAGVRDPSPWNTGQVRTVIHEALAGCFDVVHCHVDHWGFAISSLTATPVLHTMHGRMDDSDHHPLYSRAEECLLVSISDMQREPVRGATWVGTIHHGMPLDLFPFSPRAQEPPFALFLGRISPEKRPDLAIEIARRAKIPLKIAAKVDPKDRLYFEREIAPLLGHGVEFLGEVDDREKTVLLGQAIALLFPIDWPEPFGLVAIEALACGTPVISRPKGALPEIVEEGRTGFLGLSVEDLAQALALAPELDREACRASFEKRFSRERMIEDYERIYEKLVAEAGSSTVKATRGHRLAA